MLGDVGHLLLRVAMGRAGTDTHQGRRRVRQGAGRFHDGVQGVGDRRFQRAVLGRLVVAEVEASVDGEICATATQKYVLAPKE